MFAIGRVVSNGNSYSQIGCWGSGSAVRRRVGCRRRRRRGGRARPTAGRAPGRRGRRRRCWTRSDHAVEAERVERVGQLGERAVDVRQRQDREAGEALAAPARPSPRSARSPVARGRRRDPGRRTTRRAATATMTAASIACRAISASSASSDHGGSGNGAGRGARAPPVVRGQDVRVRVDPRHRAHAGWLRKASTPAIWPGSSARMCAKAMTRCCRRDLHLGVEDPARDVLRRTSPGGSGARRRPAGDSATGASESSSSSASTTASSSAIAAPCVMCGAQACAASPHSSDAALGPRRRRA